MTRVIRYRNYGVYVGDERGVQHHLAHAHIKMRGRRVASVYLATLDLFHVIEAVPEGLMDQIREQQLDLIDEWERLNS